MLYLVIVQPFQQYAPIVAVNDTFGESGTPAELMHKYEIDAEAVVKAVKRVLAR